VDQVVGIMCGRSRLVKAQLREVHRESNQGISLLCHRVLLVMLAVKWRKQTRPPATFLHIRFRSATCVVPSSGA
jgi:hypothetical protein